MKYTGHREPPEVWAIRHAVSCLHHFGTFCFPGWNGLFPCFHISSQGTRPIISCCKWCSSQSPELITDSVVEPLCWVHAPYLSQWSFLGIMWPSEFSIQVFFPWRQMYHTSPILTAQGWLRDWRGAVLQNLRIEPTKEKRQAGILALPFPSWMMRVYYFTFLSAGFSLF